MASLRESLRGFLKDWRDDLSAPWRSVLEGVEPDFDGVRADLELDDGEVIFPGREGKPVSGSPPRAHIFRGLQAIRPNTVRAVILGQDPYPNRAWATGRAFEQGNLKQWPLDPKLVADSLARILQTLVACRTGDRTYVKNDAAWKKLVLKVQAGDLEILPPHRLFSSLQRKGVLFLNTALTLSRFQKGGGPEQLDGHIPLWRPIIRRILLHLATRSQGAVVFLLWGGPAKRVFRESKVREAAKQSGTWNRRAFAVTHPHPAAVGAQGPSFFRDPNPFLKANELLVGAGMKAIDW
jgi:uracil-DNA glycosylase